ncbi:hypothetical protein ABPG75_009699 [Micractinium tetrahymenae]
MACVTPLHSRHHESRHRVLIHYFFLLGDWCLQKVQGLQQRSVKQLRPHFWWWKSNEQREGERERQAEGGQSLQKSNGGKEGGARQAVGRLPRDQHTASAPSGRWISRRRQRAAYYIHFFSSRPSCFLILRLRRGGKQAA